MPVRQKIYNWRKNALYIIENISFSYIFKQ